MKKTLRNNTTLYNVNAQCNNKKKIHWFFREKIGILSSFLVGVGQSESQFKRANGPRTISFATQTVSVEVFSE